MISKSKTLITADLHNHSTLCDGSSTPEEMIEAAINKGFSDFGISAHGYTPFDLAASMQDEAEYLHTMHSLIAEYQEKIRLYCGVEEDFHSPIKHDNYDYVIGSTHYFYDDDTGRYLAIDGSAQELSLALNEVFASDPYAMTQKFYDNVTENVFKNKPDIIGHFDIICKNNDQERFFDETDKRYKNAALEALVACLETDSIIELNTGAVFRGYRKDFYPARFILREMQQRKALLTLSADAHQTDAVGFGFSEALQLLRETGFKSILLWRDGKFQEQGII